MPQWDKRFSLLKHPYSFQGGFVFHVWHCARTNELVVVFRGTCSEFHALPQYGDLTKQTQMVQEPTYALHQHTEYKQGSETQPLVFPFYAHAVTQLWPQLQHTMKLMGADHAERITVTGHSMGAALTRIVHWFLHQYQPHWWLKTQCIMLGAPLIVNQAFVRWENQVWNVHTEYGGIIDIVNSDDFVNVKYMLAHEEGLRRSMERGKHHVAAWLAQHYLRIYTEQPHHKTPVQRVKHILQTYGTQLQAVFANGFLEQQLHEPETNPQAASRQWQPLTAYVPDHVQTLVCTRPRTLEKPSLGDGHSHYLGVSFGDLHASSRHWEDHFFRTYTSQQPGGLVLQVNRHQRIPYNAFARLASTKNKPRS